MVWPLMRYAEVAPTSARQEKKTPAHDQRLRSQKTSIVTSPCTSDSGATSMDCPSRLHGASTRSNDHRNRKAQHRSGLHTSHDDGASDDHATCVCVHASHDGDAASLRRLCLREPALRSLQEKQRQAVREPPVRRSPNRRLRERFSACFLQRHAPKRDLTAQRACGNKSVVPTRTRYPQRKFARSRMALTTFGGGRYQYETGHRRSLHAGPH